jgi:hypothetical protein
MDFTFGIITGGGNDSVILNIIESIEQQNIPNYEIIIVGGCSIKRDYVKLLPFNESDKHGWITKKKNLITNNSKYDNIVYTHDYIKFNDGWYEGQLKSGDDYKIRMDKILTREGGRFRDWCIWPKNDNVMDSIIGRQCLIPYDVVHLSKYMYISGSYWIAKKNVMVEFPLNESLTWGQGEDVQWSKEVRLKYDFSMNVNSTVQILKPNKNRAFDEANNITIEKLNQIT